MSNFPQQNLILIGMPGVGKSTVGVLLAKATGRNFVDTDVLLQAGTGRALQQIINTEGLEEFCRIEEDYLLRLDVNGHVIASGGSAVYSPAAMEHLKATGSVFWLDLPLADLESRLDNMATRGVVMPIGQSLEELSRNRRPLYEKWADIRIDCTGKTQDEIVAEIARSIRER